MEPNGPRERLMGMTCFTLHAATVTAHTTSLRADAAALQPLPTPPVPASGWFAEYRRALDEALSVANERACAITAEALRLADAMELTLQAADSVDSTVSAELGGML